MPPDRPWWSKRSDTTNYIIVGAILLFIIWSAFR